MQPTSTTSGYTIDTVRMATSLTETRSRIEAVRRSDGIPHSVESVEITVRATSSPVKLFASSKRRTSHC